MGMHEVGLDLGIRKYLSVTARGEKVMPDAQDVPFAFRRLPDGEEVPQWFNRLRDPEKPENICFSLI